MKSSSSSGKWLFRRTSEFFGKCSLACVVHLFYIIMSSNPAKWVVSTTQMTLNWHAKEVSGLGVEEKCGEGGVGASDRGRGGFVGNTPQEGRSFGKGELAHWCEVGLRTWILSNLSQFYWVIYRARINITIFTTKQTKVKRKLYSRTTHSEAKRNTRWVVVVDWWKKSKSDGARCLSCLWTVFFVLFFVLSIEMAAHNSSGVRYNSAVVPLRFKFLLAGRCVFMQWELRASMPGPLDSYKLLTLSESWGEGKSSSILPMSLQSSLLQGYRGFGESNL